MKFRLVVLFWLFGLTIWTAFLSGIFSLPKINNTLSSQEFEEKQKIPELAEILSPDQTIRLNATRRLVERVDVEKAQEILKTSGLPFTGEGHLAVHQVGFFAYKKYGTDSILLCKDYFLFACYHGAIIEAASDQGTEAISQMTDKCKSSSTRYFQCVHAAGHAILAMWDYNLPEALKTCDSLYEKEDKYPEALSSCHNGAFMENLFGVHDWGTTETPKRDWISDDSYFPCNAFDERYQKGCWLNQAARIYQMNQGDLAKTTQICEQIGNNQYIEWCMDNLSRQIHALTNGDSNQVFNLCQYTGLRWLDSCITVNAGSYYSVGDAKTAINICKMINPASKNSCYETILAQLVSDSTNKNEKRELCQQLEEPFKQDCAVRVSKLI